MSESMRIFSHLAGAKISNKVRKEFERIISVLNDFDYAIGGAVALGEYIKKPRSTSDIDFFLLDSEMNEVEEALEDAGFSLIRQGHIQFKIKSEADPKFDFDFLFSVGANPEGGLITYAKNKRILGVPNVKVAAPMYLAWMLATTGRKQHMLDLEMLLDEKLFKVTDLLDDIEGSFDPSAKKRILEVFEKRDKKATAGVDGYPETWEARQARALKFIKGHKNV